MRIRLPAIAVASLLAHAASAQSAARQSTGSTAVGTWRGTSVCLVRPSSCNDESVVYRITSLKAADSLALDARKIVHGEEQEMGILTCHCAPPNGPLTCAIPRGLWLFSVRGDSLTGGLRLRDNTPFREVRATRTPDERIAPNPPTASESVGRFR